MKTEPKQEVATANDIDKGLIEQLVLSNDLSGLTSDQRVSYYMNVCKSLGLNYLTQPFGLIKFDGKVQMYAKRDCTDQLRKLHRVNIVDIQTKKEDDLLIVTVKGEDKTGRTDMSTGVIPLVVEEKKYDQQLNGGRGGYFNTGRDIQLKNKDLANAIMKAETKAKRRLTLSLVGLGIPDESELDTMEGVKVGTFETPPGANEPEPENETIDAEILDYWNQALKDCKTPEEVDTLALNNREIVEPSKTLRKMFNIRKDQIKKPDAKERASRVTEQVKDMFKQQSEKK